MKLKALKIKNFRGYREETIISFDEFTAFVGKNDVGKSSVLEALDIFFNNGNGVTKLDKTDINVNSKAAGESDIVIATVFDNLPEEICIDKTNNTSLSDEYLLNEDGLLEIVKKYPNAGTAKVYVRAYHPTNPSCSDLLQKKDSELRKIIDSSKIDCPDKTRNATMRRSIWNFYSNDLQLALQEIDISKGDTKSIWEKLQTYLPVFTLFQADRKNTDGDSEVQDPLREAVKEILKDEDLQNSLNHVAEVVETKLKEVSARTLEKLKQMSPDIAGTLNPVIPTTTSLKWSDVFKNVSITGDENIPINKRGSGVKRLILINFFRATVERRREEENISSVIYAIEEPETSQHTDNQLKLIKALLDLAYIANTQVVITTHSAPIVKEINLRNIRLIIDENGEKKLEIPKQNQLPYVSLNEINYLAFSEVSAEYHDELYGYIDEQGLLNRYKSGKPTRKYIRQCRDGSLKEEQKVLSEYIRHLIHHPENIHNTRYTYEELKESIDLMREFISSNV